MKPAQWAIVALAVLAVAGIALYTDRAQSPARSADGTIRVLFDYSLEKEKKALVEPLVAAFNEEEHRFGGRTIVIDAQQTASGEAQIEIARGRLKPVAWSPSTSLWGPQLNYRADRELAPKRNPVLMRTPLVIAMWEPMARALGHPRRRIGFADILRLARSARGWGAVGHPELGAFKFIHPHPDFSTTGLSATVAEYYFATGKKEGLTLADVKDPRARAIVRGIERSMVHYGDTTVFVSERLHEEGDSYASAVMMEESTVLNFNRTRRPGRDRLVAIYPREGTFLNDHPFVVLDAPWVSAAQREAAERFGRFLVERITPELAARHNFRPAALDAKPVSPVDRRNGVDPSKPDRLLRLPEPKVLVGVQNVWRRDRKPANVLVVLDTSGSMNDADRLERAKDGLKLLLRQVGRQDAIGLLTFSDELRTIVPLSSALRALPRVRREVARLAADGGTALYDATARAFADVRALRAEDRINAVVLLTDGEDTDSSLRFEDLVRLLGGQGDSSAKVRLFTIAYGADVAGAREQLAAIARATGGRDYEGTTEDIEAVYKSISSFF
jgi:Ca-activated chloride channel family protein